MKKWYCLIVFVILFTACQKEIEPFEDSGSETENAIKGTWNFVSISAHTQSTAEYTDAGINYKTITYSDYITANNTGTITFSDSALASANIGYSVSSALNGYSYENNVLVDSAQMPFSLTIDSLNSSGNYELIGSDSIYFFGGGFIPVSGSSELQPSGGKFNISGKLLTITQLTNKDTTKEISGAPYHLVETGKFIIQLQKQ